MVSYKSFRVRPPEAKLCLILNLQGLLRNQGFPCEKRTQINNGDRH